MKLTKWLPELYLSASVIFYWVSTANLLNPFAVALLLLLALLFVFKNALLGVIISFMFFLLSAFMVLALLSELAEFTVFNGKAQVMLAVGGTWLGLNLFLSVKMMVKWGGRMVASQAIGNI